MTASDRPILIAYDGSANSDHAIAVAGELLGGGRAELIHAWEPLTSAAARAAVYVVTYDDTRDTLDQETAQAHAVAARGVALAAAAGFDASGSAVSGSGPLWQTIVDHAEQLQPRLIVMGTRGLTGLRSALSGSVSHHVTSHASRPVLTVPLRRDGSARG
jgi:nucleotide-binding universal stress UspA family protein